MRILALILSLLLDVRAHIPNQPSFGSGPAYVSYRTSPLRAVAACLITVAFLSVVIWMTVRLVLGFL